jgi:hypothetical protein
MVANIDPARESDGLLLMDLLAPDDAVFPPEVAQWILSIKFSDDRQARMLDLADRGNQGTLSDAEKDEIHRYARVGDVLTLLHCKARLSLRQSVRSA